MNGSRRARTSLVLAACLLTPSTSRARGTIELTHDLNTGPPPTYDRAAGAARPTAVGDRLFFAGRDAEHGIELWTSDGTEAGTRMVADIHPGPNGSFPERLVDVGGIAYFVADDGAHGAELWRSDGTKEGTRMVRDIMPGPEESDTWNLVDLNGILFFNADDGVVASELWRSDGTTEGTTLVKDLWPGPEHGGPDKLTRVGDVVYFVANDGTHGKELWVTDGTTAGTRRLTDISPGPADSIVPRRAPHPLVELNGELYFPADDGVHGFELWKTDGTSAGTALVRDFVPGAESSYATPMLQAGGYVYFNTNFEELWVTDGSEAGTRRISEVADASGLAVLGDRVLFIANPAHKANRGHQLQITDGTAAGTILLVDVLTTPKGCAPRQFIRDLFGVGDRVYFAARATGADEELWMTDGTASGTHKVVDIVADGGCDPRDFASLGDTLYFIANDRQTGSELWRSDGTAEGTALVRDNFKSTADFFLRGDLVPFGSEVFFAGPTGLYRSDGTEPGTHVVSGTESMKIMENAVGRPVLIAAAESILFWEDTGNSAVLWRLDGASSTPARVETFPQALQVGGVAFGGDVIFVTKERGGRLWRTDGYRVEPLFDFTPVGYNVSERLFATSDLVFFTASDPEHSWELWRTDGTQAGTFMTRDNNPFGPGLDFEFVDPSHHLVYFTGNDGRNGWELWRSDGTEAGTFMLADLLPTYQSGASYIDQRAATRSGRLYFIRQQVRTVDGQEGPDELWTSDGTKVGTRLVMALPELGSSGDGIRAVGETGYFTVASDDGGGHLWRTDGTRLGTRVAFREPRVAEFTTTERAIYFTTARHGADSTLWTSDGTSSGTEALAQLQGDFVRMRTGSLAEADGRLFLMGDDGVHGFELLSASCGNGEVEADEQCDDGADNGAGRCSIACEHVASGGRVFAPLQRRGDDARSPRRGLGGGRTGRALVPKR